MATINPAIVITTKPEAHHVWMAFATWYSIDRLMPDVTVAAVFPRSQKYYHFTWMNKCGVPYIAYGWDQTEEWAINTVNSSQNRLIVQDHFIFLKPIEIKGLSTIEPSDAVKDIRECGNFKLSEWEKEKRPPFDHRWETDVVDELRVFQLWKQMSQSFNFINRNSLLEA